MKLSLEDKIKLEKNIFIIDKKIDFHKIVNRVICADFMKIADKLPPAFVDLLFIDPPYNLNKDFLENRFRSMSHAEYCAWLDSWLSLCPRLLKPESSIYICGDWRSSSAIQEICSKYFIVRNRITFEREKGRGAKNNWKNNTEDIWFCTNSEKYFFDIDAVKLKRMVLAPYREAGKPKDWIECGKEKFRMTHPSNIWTDITIPFWSMRENTPHPTQKPEKLLAKIILASSRKGDLIFDPFAGVGTSGVVAKKLGRKFAMVEIEKEYCLYALKRLELAEKDKCIQGFEDGFFWERNSRKNKK